MKKFLYSFFCILIICLLCVGCSNQSIDNDTDSAITTNENIVEASSTVIQTTESHTEKQTEKQTEIQTEEQTSQINANNVSTTTATTTATTTTTITTTQKSQSNPLISDEDLEKIENSNAEVYFTDNPNNEYIVAISDKYGAKKENLVALIKVNAEFPSAMVFEFSGKKDENGELIMTYDEFKYFYNIDETNNKIRRVSKNGVGNDGVNFVEAKVYLMIAREYLIPELPNLKANKRYPE